MLDIIVGVLEQGLIFGIMALGVYITYAILDFPDLSVDGTFPLGASVAAAQISAGTNPFLATFYAILIGMIAGGVTGCLHVKFKITNLLSGILVMIGLYSVNLRIMGKSNTPLFGFQTVFYDQIPPLVPIVICIVLAKVLLDLFLKTKYGYVLKATGDNPQLITSLGLNIGHSKIIGLMLSNGIVAFAGALFAQYQGTADVGMGAGTIVTGLASVILGTAILRKIPFIKPTTMVICGAILYQGSIALALKLGLAPQDLKLVTSLIVIVALAINHSDTEGIKSKWKNVLIIKDRTKKKGGDVCVQVESQKLSESLQ